MDGIGKKLETIYIWWVMNDPWQHVLPTNTSTVKQPSIMIATSRYMSGTELPIDGNDWTVWNMNQSTESTERPDLESHDAQPKQAM